MREKIKKRLFSVVLCAAMVLQGISCDVMESRASEKQIEEQLEIQTDEEQSEIQSFKLQSEIQTDEENQIENDLAEDKPAVLAVAGFSAEDIDIKFTDPTQSDPYITIDIQIPNCNKEISATYYYRDKTDSTGNSIDKNITIDETGKATSKIAKDNIKEGAVYVFTFNIDGVEKTIEYTYGTAEYTPTISAAVNPYDATLTFKLNSSEIKTGKTYRVNLDYAFYANNKVSTYYGIESDINLNSDNNYTATVKTADYTIFYPNTKYYLKWSLYAGGNYYYYYQTITTKEGIAGADTFDIAMDKVSFRVYLGGDTSDFEKDIKLYAYLRKEGESYPAAYSKEVNLYKKDEYKKTISFDGLNPNTKYYVSLRDTTYGIEYGNFSFTTLVDDRTLNVDSVSKGINSFRITATVTGENFATKNYIILYYRTKGGSTWEKKYRSFLKSDISSAFSFDIGSESSPLSENTTFEYKIGIGNTEETSIDTLLSAKSGEVATLKDDRNLTFDITTSTSTITFKGQVTGTALDEKGGNNILIYYREKGADGSWTKVYKYFTKLAYDFTISLPAYMQSALKEGTTYEYVIGLGESSSTKMENLKQKKTGEATTKTANTEEPKPDEGSGDEKPDTGTEIETETESEIETGTEESSTQESSTQESTTENITTEDSTTEETSPAASDYEHKPRIEVNKTTVNTALDYSNSYGIELAKSLYGAVEIIPVYDELVKSVTVVNNDETATNFAVKPLSDYEYIITAQGEVKSGTYKLKVTTAYSATPFEYQIKITVVNKKPKVTAKVTQGMNLFYINEYGQAEITLENTDCSIESVTWKDKQENSKEGFEFTYYKDSDSKPQTKIYKISQKNVKVENGKLSNSSVDSGKLTVKLNGVKESYDFNLTIKHSYKKPTLKTLDSQTGKNSSNIIPAIDGGNSSEFMIYDSLNKQYLIYNSLAGSGNETDNIYYNKIETTNEAVVLIPKDNCIDFVYNKEEKGIIPITLSSPNWRETLTLKHGINVIQPKAVLGKSSLTFNAQYMSVVSTNIALKDFYVNDYANAAFDNIAISGANSRAQGLIDDGTLKFEVDGLNIYVKLDKEKPMPNAAYTFNITPSYIDKTGNNKSLNTLKLKVKFISSDAAASISTKGTIDLALTPAKDESDTINSITLSAKFANIGTGYEVVGAELQGTESEYFELVPSSVYGYATSYLKLAKVGLRAGQSYSLTVNYSVKTTDGEILTVKSKPFKVKPKQTAPKITVTNNGQTLYVTSSLARTYQIKTPSKYNQIENAYGSIDINKDGKADIIVIMDSSSMDSNSYTSTYAYANLTVKINDKDALSAKAIGKTYTIPVTVCMVGRDGVSKDSVVKISVKVKG